ncbi:threonyl-tRNA synthetase editing domain-containing protein [Thermosulfuriphilus sp.]
MSQFPGIRSILALKLLLFFAKEFWSSPFAKVLPGAEEPSGPLSLREAVVVFYHLEAEDMGREKSLIGKMVKNIKWLAGKFATKTVLLHSFSHLSTSKAPPELALAIIPSVRQRLERAGFLVHETPFGYLNEWKMHVGGESLAKVFKDL